MSDFDSLTKEDLDRRIQALEYRKAVLEAREHLIPFMRLLHPDPNRPDDPTATLYSVQRHHEVISQALEEIAEGKILRVALSVPPQHGKSELTSRGFPAWHLGKFPWKHLMTGTYNQDFANEFGEDVRAILRSPQYEAVFPGTRLRTGSSAKDHMVTESRGKLAFLGRGGSGTGRPADGMVVDDPIKDAKEAESLTIRDDVWQWFTRVMSSRLHGASWLVVIMTRWHEDDLVGRLTDRKNKHYKASVAKQWHVINIPAIQDDPEMASILGKKVGDALWPERFPLTLLETVKAMNPVAFSAMYQGKPTPPEGAFFKRQDIFTYDSPDELPKRLVYYGAGDLAVSPERNADSSVVGTVGVDESDTVWVMPGLYWDKRAADESVEEIIDQCAQWHWSDSFWEKGQLDRAVGPFLEKRAMERAVVLNMQRFPATGSKAFRASSIRGRMRMGKVKFPSFAPWWERALDQLLKFTGSGDDAEDDFADFIAMIGQGLQLQLTATKAPQPQKIIKVGSLAWIKAVATRERKESEREKRIASM